MNGDNDAGVDDDMKLEKGSGSKRWELAAGERFVFNGGLCFSCAIPPDSVTRRLFLL